MHDIQHNEPPHTIGSSGVTQVDTKGKSRAIQECVHQHKVLRTVETQDNMEKTRD